MTKKPPPPVCMLRGHEGVVTSLTFTDEVDAGITAKPSLISGSDTGEIFIWNLQMQRSYHHFKAHDGKMILYLAYFKSSLISQGRDGMINIWKFIKNEWNIMRLFKCPNYGFCASTLLPTEKDTLLVTPTGDGSSITFYNYETAEVLFNYEYKANSTLGSVLECGRETCMCIRVLLKNTKIFLLMGYDSGDIALWNYETKREESRLKCHSEVVLCLDFDTKYKQRGISGSVDKNLQVWKIDENNQLVSIHQVAITNPGVNALKIRDDGKIVITAGQDFAIRVFSWKNLRPLAVLQHHTMPVISLSCYDASFSNYKSIFASGSKDKNILLWSIY